MPNIADYVFTNVSAQLTPLEAFLDPFTHAELDEIGVGEGWTCLDLGAGGGSITNHLAALVGPLGRVTAVDQDPHMLKPGPNIDVHTQDMSKDEPLPAPGPFELIHARLLTHHLPNRRELVHRLAGTLKPGGWLLLGEFVLSEPYVVTAHGEQEAGLFRRVLSALYEVGRRHGVHQEWGNEVHATMLDAGLTEVRTRWHSESWTGGEHGSRLLANNVSQKREQIIETGLTGEEVDTFTDVLMRDPRMVVRSHLFCSIRGRRPA
jgi:SAM-dependent methyltransferase